MKPKIYPIILRCVEDGAQIGYFNSVKHDDKPSVDLVVDKIIAAIMAEIDNAFTFDDELELTNEN